MAASSIISTVACAALSLLLAACGSVTPSNVSGRDASRDVGTRADVGPLDAGTDSSPCSSGEPGVLCLAATPPARQNGPLAVDNTNVYWGEDGPSDETSFIASIPRAGGAVMTLATSLPLALATDGVNLYWGHATSRNPTGELLVVSVAGGQVSTLATGPLPRCIVLDDDNVYWTDEYTGSVSKVAKSGGPAVTLAPLTGHVVQNQNAIALDSSSVYWVGGGVFKVGKGGGPVTTLLSAEAGAPAGVCRSLDVVGGSVVTLLQPAPAVDSPDAEPPVQVVTFPSSGGGTPRVVVPSGFPFTLVANATTVYWAAEMTSIRIGETPIGGGPSTLLATPAAYLVSDMALAGDGTLYWLTNSQVQSIKP